MSKRRFSPPRFFPKSACMKDVWLWKYQGVCRRRQVFPQSVRRYLWVDTVQVMINLRLNKMFIGRYETRRSICVVGSARFSSDDEKWKFHILIRVGTSQPLSHNDEWKSWSNWNFRYRNEMGADTYACVRVRTQHFRRWKVLELLLLYWFHRVYSCTNE